MPEAVLSPKAWSCLIEETAHIALLVGRDFGGEETPVLSAGASGAPDSLSGREHLALFVDALPGLEQAMHSLSQEPHRAVQHVGEEITLTRARGTDPNALVRALPRSVPAPEETAFSPLAQRLGGFLPPTLTERVPRTTADTPENRYVARCLREWRRDVRLLTALAEHAGEEENAARAQAVQSALERLESLFARVLPPSETTVSPCLPTHVLRMDARYRRFLDLERQRRRRLIHLHALTALLLPVRPAWEWYEIWCFFRVVAALRSLGFRAQNGDAVRLVQEAWQVSLAKGQASRLTFVRDGQFLELWYNRRFPSARETSGGLNGTFPGIASRTHTMIPDITVQYRNRLLLLDAKFRVYEAATANPFAHTDTALLDDLDKMHAYRDALEQESVSVVSAAWCLAPGTPSNRGQEAGVVAFPGVTSQHPFGTAGIGVLELCPGVLNETLPRLLAHFLPVSPKAGTGTER